MDPHDYAHSTIVCRHNPDSFLINNSITHVTSAWSYEHVLIRSQTSFAVLKVFHYRGKCIAVAEVSSWQETKCKALKMFKSPMPIPRRPRSNLLELSEVNVFFTPEVCGVQQSTFCSGRECKVRWPEPSQARLYSLPVGLGHWWNSLNRNFQLMKLEQPHSPDVGKALIPRWGAECSIPRFYGTCFLLVFFYKLNVCGSPGLSGLLAPFFQQHLSHVGKSNNFSLPWYLLQRSVISDLRCYYHNCFGDPQSLLYKMNKLTDSVCRCSDRATDRPFPGSLPLLRSYLKHNNTEIRPINNPKMASKCSDERMSHMSLTVNQNLEIIKLSEEGTSKAETGWILGLLCQMARQAVDVKGKVLKGN